MVQSDPSLLEDILEVTEEQNPQLVQFILDNKADFLRLVLEQPQEPNNGGDSGNQVGESEETQVDQTQADQTNKPNNGGGDGANQVGESEETEVKTTKDAYAKTRVEAEIERLEKKLRLHGVAPVRSLPCTARPMITFITSFELQMHPNVSKNSMWYSNT
ncbi:hypothetical protein F2Q68_00027506 [Brassica cretica]|uniref:XPC-binding domain-containing protein n=1 Tax=Brassica cretica TaxID=69181 RepID=A0A8S9I818_BRACR|nr:hypothetical protein F2Q68_00027506 [Brassica cretica]